MRVDRSQPKGLILNSRILWTFSAVHRFRPDPLYRQMADRAFDFVMNRFWDEQYGGAFWQLDGDGRVLDASKKTYGQAFYIYALAEYHLAFGAPAALKRAAELFDLLERHAHDAQQEGYWEVRSRDWSEAADSRLSDKEFDDWMSKTRQYEASVDTVAYLDKAFAAYKALLQGPPELTPNTKRFLMAGFMKVARFSYPADKGIIVLETFYGPLIEKGDVSGIVRDAPFGYLVGKDEEESPARSLSEFGG
jgi:uncharacterized protein YyaL (SSP411 family)